jgi:polysaccharide pyruvyl transferase WcaK-like protein
VKLMKPTAAPSKPRKLIPIECVSWRGHNNLGDEMIFAAQQAMFNNTLKLGQYVSRPKAVLIGGGTFVPKFPEYPDLVKLSRGLPTVFFGTGIGDPLFWGTDYIADWLEVVKNAFFVGVRGPLSKERLLSWGVSRERVDWVGDPALYFAGKPRQPRNFQGKIAVNLGITYGNLYGFDEQRLEMTIVATIKELNRTGWEVTLVCAWPSDDVAIKRLKNHVLVKAVEHWHGNFTRALEAVDKFDLVLCEKLHIGVVAACRAVPFVALNYRSKVLDFCRSINWQRFCVTTANLERDCLLDLVGILAQESTTFSNRLSRAAGRVRDRLLQFAPRVEQTLLDETA